MGDRADCSYTWKVHRLADRLSTTQEVFPDSVPKNSILSYL